MERLIPCHKIFCGCFRLICFEVTCQMLSHQIQNFHNSRWIVSHTTNNSLFLRFLLSSGGNLDMATFLWQLKSNFVKSMYCFISISTNKLYKAHVCLHFMDSAAYIIPELTDLYDFLIFAIKRNIWLCKCSQKNHLTYANTSIEESIG